MESKQGAREKRLKQVFAVNNHFGPFESAVPIKSLLVAGFIAAQSRPVFYEIGKYFHSNQKAHKNVL